MRIAHPHRHELAEALRIHPPEPVRTDSLLHGLDLWHCLPACGAPAGKAWHEGGSVKVLRDGLPSILKDVASYVAIVSLSLVIAAIGLLAIAVAGERMIRFALRVD